MERMRPAMKWLRSAYIVYGIVFVGFLGGLTEILSISDDINFGLVRLLEKHPEGPSLNGTYLFPKNWLALFLFVFSLMLVFPATSLLKYFIEKEHRRNEGSAVSLELIKLRQDLDDATRLASNITGYMYPKDGALRLCFNNISIKYNITKLGDTICEAILDLGCSRPTHFYIHWIRGDHESGEVKFLRELNIQAFDVDTGQKLDWLPLINEPKSKALAVFFPEIAPGTEKKIKITYQWPRFMGKLIDLGATNFDWSYRDQGQDSLGRFRSEWVFDSSFAPLDCRIVGQASPSAKLYLKNGNNTFSWIYEDDVAQLGVKSEVEVIRLRN
jgi:hypothetical protein